MSVVIRMKRGGRRNRPHYRIAVADSRSPRDGRTIETLGHYDPLASRSELALSLDVDRAKHWIAKGALPSETVHSIFQRQGVYQDRPERKRRERPGRKRLTKTRAHRRSAQKARAERKSLKRTKSVQ